MTTVIWVILVGPVFGGRCGAEALGLGLGLSPGPAYRFALPPGLAAKTTRCLVFDQGRPTSHLHCRGSRTFDPFVFTSVRWILLSRVVLAILQVLKKDIRQYNEIRVAKEIGMRTERVNGNGFFYLRMQVVV